MIGRKYAMMFLGPFPKGNVSTIRILSYCKELVLNGNDVTVYLIAPTKEAAINDKREGQIDGVNFKYLTKITWDNKKTNIFIKFYFYCLGLVLGMIEIHKNKIDCVLSYHFNPLFNFLYSTYCKISSIELILDKTEFPAGYKNGSMLKKIFIKYNLKCFNKIITISRELEVFYGSIIGRERVYLLPVTISPERFLNVERNYLGVDFIGVVFGVHNRDNISDSIKAFNKYKQEHFNDQIELYLIGDLEKLIKLNPNLNELPHLISISSGVRVLGKISNEILPEFLVNSFCLITTALEYVSGGFPTKLGEYLLSGRPVVMTNAGEVSNYVTNNESGLICEPGNISQISEAILRLREDSVFCEKIGRTGRELALRVFNAKTYIKQLTNFLER